MAPERERGFIRNFFENNVVRKVGAIAGAAFAAATLLIPPEANEYRGSEPLIDGEYVKVYPLLAPDGLPNLPPLASVLIRPWGFDKQSTTSQSFGPQESDYDAAIAEAEIRHTVYADFVCANGEKKSYVSYETLTKQQLQENVCDDAPSDPTEAKRLKKIEDTGREEADRPDQPGSDKPGRDTPPSAGKHGGSDHNKKPRPKGCMRFNNGARLLCIAQKYEGVYYKWGGGHGIHYRDFKDACPNPQHPRNNHPYGATAYYHNGNPSPCGVDCSGLISMVVDEAFDRDKDWVVGALKNDTKNWKEIPKHKAKAGDIVTIGANEHVEFVRFMRNGVAHTFGAHRTGKKIDGDRSIGMYDSAYRYIGKGYKA